MLTPVVKACQQADGLPLWDLPVSFALALTAALDEHARAFMDASSSLEREIAMPIPRTSPLAVFAQLSKHACALESVMTGAGACRGVCAGCTAESAVAFAGPSPHSSWGHVCCAVVRIAVVLGQESIIDSNDEGVTMNRELEEALKCAAATFAVCVRAPVRARDFVRVPAARRCAAVLSRGCASLREGCLRIVLRAWPRAQSKNAETMLYFVARLVMNTHGAGSDFSSALRVRGRASRRAVVRVVVGHAHAECGRGRSCHGFYSASHPQWKRCRAAGFRC